MFCLLHVSQNNPDVPHTLTSAALARPMQAAPPGPC
jgi:hypothetical protein